jgi:hypothetical protein
MTLEINEINVQISVGSDRHGSHDHHDRLPSSTPLNSAQNTSLLSADVVELLVERCVRDVLRHLRMREQR